jgi:hypothetical protein
MLADGGRREAEDPLRIGISVRQPTLHQPVEYAIERHPIDGQIADRLLDLVVCQRRRYHAQQPQDAHPRRRRARTRAANEQGSSFSLRGGFDSILDHSHATI